MAAPSLALIPSAYKVGKVASVKPINGKGDFTFTRNSEATRINENGIIETMGVDVPRIDHTDGGCPSLLLEPASTNLQSYSQVFSGYSGSNKVITDNVTISPDGTVTGAILSDDNSGGVDVVQIFDNVTVDVSSIYTWSIFAKKKDLDFISLRLNAFSTPSNANSYFDLNLGTVVSEGNGQTATIENYGNGWYRCSITFTTDAVDTSGTLVVRLSDNGTNTTVDLDNTSNIYIWGWQFEKLPYATSYIPTNGTAVTRGAEVCNGAGDVNTFNSVEGVLYAEVAALSNDLSYRILSLSDGTSNERVYMQYTNASNTIAVVVKEDGNTQANMSYVLSDEVAFSKIAIKWKVNDFALWVNGSERATDTSGDTPIGLNSLQFDDGNSGNNFYGKTKQLQVFKTALTDAELIALTSWSSFTEMATVLKYSIQ